MTAIVALRRGEDAPADPSPAELGLSELPSAVLALGDADLSRAADALHDGALQALVVARYAADLAVRGGDPLAARDAVQDALVALRRAVWTLRPRGEQGLSVALQQLVEHLAVTGGAALHVDVDAEAEQAMTTGLGRAAASAAYRLVQSAAGEVPVTVRIRRTATGLRLALDVPVDDPAGQALRARAAGATLLATRDCTALHLPLDLAPARSADVSTELAPDRARHGSPGSLPDGAPAAAAVPAQRDGRSRSTARTAPRSADRTAPRTAARTTARTAARAPARTAPRPVHSPHTDRTDEVTP